MGKTKTILSLSACLAVSAGVLAGCGSSGTDTGTAQENTSAVISASTASVEDKVFNYGTTAFSDGVNPHNSYSGWSTVRYGIGETLAKIGEDGSLEPWVAESWENIDEYTWVIQIRDGIQFHNGKAVDGEAVKACLEDLVENHDRAPHDLQIDTIEADGQTVTIKTRIPNPVLMNYLSDPYGCIVDVTDDLTLYHAVGTGPYYLESADDEGCVVKANMDYWNGTPKVGTVNVTKITDGDTLTLALENGEIDAAQGLPYSSIQLFQDESKYTISSADTSRSFYIIYNQSKGVFQDANVRKAVACAINKEEFTSVLLNGNGTPAIGPFPASYSFGDGALTDEEYDLDKARELLAESGWRDTDGDGYVDKDGEKLTIKWITYSSRQELPLLAESAHATLKGIGVDVDINIVENMNDLLEANDFDLFAMANVSSPTGDPQYFFTAFFADGGSYDYSGWKDPEFDELLTELRSEYDPDKRSDLAIQLQKILLEQNVITVASHLRMNFVMQNGVTGFTAHPSDYYEITADLDIN